MLRPDLPTYIRLVEVGNGQAVMGFVVWGEGELTETRVVILWLLEEIEAAGRVAYPERWVGGYVHVGFLKYLEEGFVFFEDVKHFLQFLHRRETITEIGVGV